MTEVVAALIWDNDKFMICQRPAHKARGLLWEFVGGKVEPGETKEQALIRECQEELTITLDVGEVFMDVTHEYPDLTVRLTLFNASVRKGPPQTFCVQITGRRSTMVRNHLQRRAAQCSATPSADRRTDSRAHTLSLRRSGRMGAAAGTYGRSS